MDMTNNNTRFSMAPQANIERSVYGRPADLKTTHNFGQLIPLHWDEVLPAQTKQRKIGSLIRMSTPLFPVMDNAVYDIYSFFVPYRLIWTHAKEFFGENKDSAWVSAQEYYMPGLDCDGKTFQENTLFDYMGLPTKVEIPAGTFMQALPLRAYCEIYNEWFRYEATDNPIPLNYGDDDSSNYDQYTIRTAAKLHDYFTSCLPAPQFGESSGLLFADGYANVFAADNNAYGADGVTGLLNRSVNYFGLSEDNYNSGLSSNYLNGMVFTNNDTYGMPDFLGFGTQPSTNPAIYPGSAYTIGRYVQDATSTAETIVSPINLYADLNTATVATINQLRQAIAVQQLLERTARSGNRYTEYVRAAFGVISPDSRLQRPELIGHIKINLNMQQVVQTSFDGGTDNQTPLGSTGAMSKTNDYSNLYTYSATEHGIIMTLGVARTELTYQQGLDKKWSRRSRYDFYDPIFNGIGEMPVLNQEIFFSDDKDENDAVFGYQEAWADYRYSISKVTGAFRSNHSQSLDAWHYAEEFTTTPRLSTAFIHQGASVVDRTLAVSSDSAHQLLCNFWFDDTDYSPMPVYSVPGLSRI